MGLFDYVRGGVRQSNQTALGPAEAFAAIALIAIGIDGYVSDEEARSVMTTLMRMQLFRSYPNEVVRRMIDKLVGILQRQGTNVLFSAALSALPHDLQDTAFAVATDIALADGTITEEEESFLNSLYSALDVPEHVAKMIIEVMLIKNRG